MSTTRTLPHPSSHPHSPQNPQNSTTPPPTQSTSPTRSSAQGTPKYTTTRIGRLYENEAAQYLRQKGYHILEKNYSFQNYEIDLIALTPGGDLVFLEIKYRSDPSHFSPIETPSHQQQKHIMTAAEHFLAQHPNLTDRMSQYDVIFFSDKATSSPAPAYAEIPAEPTAEPTAKSTIKPPHKTSPQTRIGLKQSPPNNAPNHAQKLLSSKTYTLTHIEQAFEHNLS